MLEKIGDKAREMLAEATGQAVVSQDRLELLEQVEFDYRILRRDTDLLGWGVMDFMGGRPTELSPATRRNIVQRARVVWAHDAQAGAACELMNDFVFGRGVPGPRCKDKAVQDWVDENWNDPDNKRVLTTIDAQTALGNDLAIQSNLFVLFFDDGDDGKVKLSLLSHDSVNDYVPHPEKRHRVLYYLAAEKKQEWDYKNDTMKIDTSIVTKPTYYEDFEGVKISKDEDDLPEDGPDPDRIGDGRVYHLRINRLTEQQFGVPRFQRTIRWYTAYNDFLKARLDMAQAAAAIIMKRKIKGTASQLARDAAKIVSRQSPLAGSGDPYAPQVPPRPASIVDENESVSHEALNLNSGGSNANADAQMIRAPLSAAERWPQSYLGDASSANLATATSLELPVLKAVESRQEVFEQLFRAFLDRVIQKGVEVGKIKKGLTPREVAEKRHQPLAPDEVDALDQEERAGFQIQQTTLVEAAREEIAAGREITEVGKVKLGGHELPLLIVRDEEGRTQYRLIEAYEDKGQDEEDTERDLGYEFSMPSPLRRMMMDLVAAIQAIATTFDPNNTNVELSRALLTIALGEGLEVQDPADLVDKIFPPGDQDPTMKMQREQAQQAQQPPDNLAGNVLPDLTQLLTPNGGQQSFGKGGDSNFYGGPMNSTPADRQRIQQAKLQPLRRDGSPVELGEHFDDLPEPIRRRAQGRIQEYVSPVPPGGGVVGAGSPRRARRPTGHEREAPGQDHLAVARGDARADPATATAAAEAAAACPTADPGADRERRRHRRLRPGV